MNLATPTKLKKEETPSTASLPGEGDQSPAGEVVKGWIKKLPFFGEMDYLRRKIYDSRLFDFMVKPLADTLEDWPRIIELDITNRCNAKCVWCPNPELTDLGAMDMPLYRKIIDDYARRGGVVRIGTFGEPLMDKTFGEKIEYLRKYPSIRKIEVVNNAFFLNEKIARIIIDNQVDVEISLDELEKETFEEVKKMSYDVVRTNILRFLAINDKAVKPVNVNLRIKSSLSRQETENHEFYKKLTEHRCLLELTPIEEDCITSWAGKFDRESFYTKYMQNSLISKKYNYKTYNKKNTAPCNQLWKWMVVYWDGSVVPCCVDMFATTVQGNLRDSTIAEVWNGPAMTELRKKMVRRERFEIPLCKECDLHLGWQNLKNHYDPDSKTSIYKEGNPFVG